MEDDPDQALIDGNGTPSDYDLLTGGVIAANQNAVDAADNGTLNNANTGTGSANTPTIPPAQNGSTYTPPGWLSAVGNLAGTVGTAATQLTPIINGHPAVSPAAAGQAGTNNGSGILKPIVGTSPLTSPLVLGLGALAAWFFFFRK